MTQRNIKTCDSSTCRAPIIWCYTENGKRIPLDAEPTQRTGVGVYVIEDDGVHCRPFSPMWDGYTHERHINHFATCPDRDAFSTKGS